MTARILDDGEVKALFRQLVTAAGGVQAAGIELGVSHQRVSLLQSPGNAEIPNLRQIMALEVVAGQPIVSAAVARAITGEVDESLTAAMVGAVTATAEAMGEVHAMEADGHRSLAEIRAVQTKTTRALREAEEAHALAMRLTPGPASGPAGGRS